MTQANFIAGLLLAVALSVLLSLGGSHYMELRRASQQNNQRGQVIVDTGAGIQQGQVNAEDAFRINRGLNLGEITFRYQLDEAIRHEPATAERAVRTVPDSVRNAYRERRLARERLRCAGEQCPQ